jgi:transposase
LAALLARVLPHLGERHRRLVCGAAAIALGRGGVTRVAEVAKVSVPTVTRGARELDEPPDPYGRHRRHGGGPKRATERQPGLATALDRLVDPDTRGDPQSPLRWTTKSTRHLADALGALGFQVSADTVGRLLKQQGYRLQRTHKTLEGAQHPDRDAQFGYLNQQARAHLAAGQPVISVDAKKKELVGNYANGGVEWQPAGAPVEVAVHDFPDPTVGKAIPYGVYDIAPTAAGCRSAATTTPPRSPWRPFAAGSSRSAWRCTPTPTGRWSPPTPAGPTATGSGCGRPSWPAWPPTLALQSRSATSHPAPRSGTGSSTGCSATSR